MNSSIKARLAALQAAAAEKPRGVAIMTLLGNGTWTACKGPHTPSRVFQTEQAARAYLSGCKSIIIIDI